MAATIQVGVLRAQLTADTAKFTAGFREADATVKKFTAGSQRAASENKRASDLMIAGMSAAGKASSASGKMIAGMSEAGRQAAAAQAAAAQAAVGYGARLKGLGTQALDAAKSTGLLNNSIGKLALGVGGLAIVGQIVSTIANLGAQAIETAGKLVDLSAATGLSLKALQQMDAVAQQTGSTLDTFAKATVMLGVRVEGASKPIKAAIDALGLSLKTLQAMRPEEQFRVIMDALGRMATTQARNEAALALFGKTFQELTPAMVEGYGKLADAAKIAGDAQILALDAAGDAWTRFKNNTAKTTVDVLGSLVLMAEGFKNTANWRAKLGALVGDPGSLAFLAGEAAVAAAGTKDQGTAAAAAAPALETYAQRLAAVRKELAALTPAQRAEIAAAQALGATTDELAKLEAKFGLSEGAIRVLTQAITDSTKAAKDHAKTIAELAEGYAAWLKAIEAVNQIAGEGRFWAAGEMAEKNAKKATQTADVQLAALNRRFEAERETAQASQEIEEQRTEFAIEQARRSGATWQQLYAMEKDLADARLQRAIDQAKLEFEIRTAWIDRTTAVGEAEYHALEQKHDATITRMVEAHTQAETIKRRDLARTHNFWIQQLDGVRAFAKQLADQMTADLAGLFFGLGHEIDESTKKAAASAREHYDTIRGESAKTTRQIAAAHAKMVEAQQALDAAKGKKASADELQRLSAIVVSSRMAYERIATDGKASAEEIEKAFDEMREAEDAANETFAERFVNLWKGVKQTLVGIFNEILQAFTKQLIGGMIRALAGQRLAGAFGNFLGGAAPGGGLLGSLLGGGAAAAGGGLLASSAVPTSLAMSAVPGIGTGTAAAAAAPGAAASPMAFLSNPAFWTNPYTIAAIGGIALGLAVWKKGLFRGGAEALVVNPRRDQFLGQFGDPSNKGTGGAGWNLAALLTRLGAGEGGGGMFALLQRADSKKEFEQAQANIVTFLAQKGKKGIKSFGLGGLVPGFGAIPAILHGGEGILSALGMRTLGASAPEGAPSVLQAINAGQAPGAPSIVNVAINVRAWDSVDAARWFRTQGIAEIKQAILLNTGDLGAAVKGAA